MHEVAYFGKSKFRLRYAGDALRAIGYPAFPSLVSLSCPGLNCILASAPGQVL